MRRERWKRWRERSRLRHPGYNLSTVNTVLIWCKHGRGANRHSDTKTRPKICKVIAPLRPGLVDAEWRECHSANVLASNTHFPSRRFRGFGRAYLASPMRGLGERRNLLRRVNKIIFLSFSYFSTPIRADKRIFDAGENKPFAKISSFASLFFSSFAIFRFSLSFFYSCDSTTIFFNLHPTRFRDSFRLSFNRGDTLNPVQGVKFTPITLNQLGGATSRAPSAV